MRFTKHFNIRKTPQSAAIPGSNQVRNSAGGFTWTVTPDMLLDRFLVLGSEKGTYYVSEQKLTTDHATNLTNLIKADGQAVVNRIVSVSKSGRAPKNAPAIFALALCAAFGDVETRRAAFTALPKVCRTGTHLFHFIAEVEQLRGWGRGLRRAVGGWYNAMPIEDLTYQTIKYQSRDKWSNRDLLRLSHPKPATPDHKKLYKWIVDGEVAEGCERLTAFEQLKQTKNADEAVRLITEHKLPRECVPTELLTEARIWEALLKDMPLNAMVRNLANMTRCGLLTPGSAASAEVIKRLGDRDVIQRARLHPLGVLLAHATYAKGSGFRSANTWIPVPRIVDALDSAFYLAFDAVRPANKRTLIGLDVSGSMTGNSVAGSPLMASEAAAALAMVTLATEPVCQTMAFAQSFRPLNLSPKMRLADVLKLTQGLTFGATDCAQPMLWASAHKVEVDTFMVLTDNETWFGGIHPKQALDIYRQETGIKAKLVVVGMASNQFTIADPSDPGMLDVVGFDASAPSVISQFSAA